MKKYVLASGSPRRRELMEMAGISFDIIVSNADESLPEGISSYDAVRMLSEKKALEVLSRVEDGKIVIGADTVVSVDERILGKPHDDFDAFDMLKMLSGREHQVYTGVTICSPEKKLSFVQTTNVYFYNLSDEQIREYVATGEPRDKAGAYGIQGKGGLLCEKIEGDYFNVVGLPIARLKRELEKF